MRILVFDTETSGHHLEYLHHIFNGAVERINDEYVFYVPFAFNEVKDLFLWKETSNILIKYIPENKLNLCRKGSIYKRGWNKSLLIRDALREFNCNTLLLVVLMEVIPFVLFVIPQKVTISGIIYMIYLYEQDKMSKLRLLIEKSRYWLLSKSKNINKIFILNDKKSADYFNNRYKTNKFVFLPDPVPNVNISNIRNIRNELGINKSSYIYLHFGVIDERKGTYEILEAISLLSKTESEDKVFIFAGKVADTFKNAFYSKIKNAERKANILVYDEFCSYDFIYNLCYICDVILIPYKFTNLSSGVLGYASVFKKPVIGPKQGIIGRCIEEYKLGCCLENVDPVNIKEALLYKFDNLGFTEYSQKNCCREFINTVLSI